MFGLSRIGLALGGGGGERCPALACPQDTCYQGCINCLTTRWLILLLSYLLLIILILLLVITTINLLAIVRLYTRRSQSQEKRQVVRMLSKQLSCFKTSFKCCAAPSRAGGGILPLLVPLPHPGVLYYSAIVMSAILLYCYTILHILLHYYTLTNQPPPPQRLLFVIVTLYGRSASNASNASNVTR